MSDTSMTLPRVQCCGLFRFARKILPQLLLLVSLWIGSGSLSPLRAGEEKDMEEALLKLSKPHEKAGFDFRADIWQRELQPEVGKAVRIQMFKGNEYRVCVSVAPGTGVKVAAHVLDFEGKPAESKIETSDDGSGTTLHVKPKNTGVYLVVVRYAGGEKRKAICGMITGYR